ncbi:DUF4258 domain-containing protein [bacterium]|nr:DUF4258 domain-containing protein [bacterium]
MKTGTDFHSMIRQSAEKKLLFLPHAIRQMSRYDRMISRMEVRSVIESGEIIEEYPEDQRGHSALMLGKGRNNRPLHVVCAPKKDYLAIITAYIPLKREWLPDFKTRRMA